MQYQMKWSCNQNDGDKFKLGQPLLSAHYSEGEKQNHFIFCSPVSRCLHKCHPLHCHFVLKYMWTLKLNYNKLNLILFKLGVKIYSSDSFVIYLMGVSANHHWASSELNK